MGLNPLTSSLEGVPIIGTRYVPVGEFLRTPAGIYFHRHEWYSGRYRKPHGRTNGPRKLKVKKRIYIDPAMQRILDTCATS